MPESKVAVLVRMRAVLKDKITELAKREHRSVNQQIEFLLESSIADADPPIEQAKANAEQKRK
jgi:hypothetical protein